nr:hypothetical protein [Tanacetum cinerariifolium]
MRMLPNTSLRLVKASFEKIQPMDYMDNLLLHNLKTMFEHHVKDNVWKNQQRKPRRKVTEVPQPSDPIEHVADKAVNEEMDNSLERAATTATSLDATPNEPGSQGTSSGGGPRCQETMWHTVAYTRSERVSKISNDLLLVEVNTPQSGEDILKLNELMELCTKLQQRVLDLETTKTTEALEIDSLKRRVKKLKRRKRSRTYGLKRLYKATVEEDGVTRLKKYSELSAAEAIQADCNVKATNIILQGLPPNVYALVTTHKVAKELWERIQMLMQGTSLTKQERECKLYDEFDKFAYRKGETLRDFYLRFALLLNDMNMYNIKLEQFQVNTKFLNTLPSEWSKIVTDVKLVRDMHTTNIDQLHAYLGQHEYNAYESYHQHQFQPQASTYQSSPYATRYHPPQYASQAPSSSNLSISYPPNDIQSSVNHNVYMASSSIPQMEYAPTVHHQSEFSSPETGLVVLVFQKGDDPIDAINHMMSFLTAIVTSRYPATNNQLRTSSNPCQQATINNGRVTIQPIQGRKNSMTAGSSRPYALGSGGASGKQRVIVCYNCKGEGHMSKQCTKPKRKRDAEWFKDKVLLVQAQANGKVLQEEELEFFVDPRTAETSSNQYVISKN